MSIAKLFGAVADGVAGDTAALQHAVNDGDGVLELTRGTYRISRPVVLDLARRKYLGVRGGQGTATVVMAAAGPAFRLVGNHQGTADPPSVKPETWRAERFPVLSGFEILGAHPEADGIELRGTMQATIRCMLVRKCRYGIHLAERNRNFILSESHIYDGSDTGILMDNVNLHQTNIVGNHLNDHKQGTEAAGGSITLRGCRDLCLSGCQILDPHQRGIHLLDTSRCKVSDNFIADRHDPPRMLTAIEVSGDAGDNVIQGNTVDRGTAAAIACSEAHGRVLGNTVWGEAPRRHT